jgi:hypothetical protein
MLRLGYNTGRTVSMICFVFDFILRYVFVLHKYAVARIQLPLSLIDMTGTPEVKATPASVQGVHVNFYVHMDFASPYRPETCSK